MSNAPVKKKLVRKSKPVKKKQKTQTEIPEIAGVKTEVRKRRKGRRINVRSIEIRNVIADTLERLESYPHGKHVDPRATCEQQAEVLTREIVYGLSELGYVASSEPITEVVEHEYPSIPTCKEHK